MQKNYILKLILKKTSIFVYFVMVFSDKKNTKSFLTPRKTESTARPLSAVLSFIGNSCRSHLSESIHGVHAQRAGNGRQYGDGHFQDSVPKVLADFHVVVVF